MSEQGAAIGSGVGIVGVQWSHVDRIGFFNVHVDCSIIVIIIIAITIISISIIINYFSPMITVATTMTNHHIIGNTQGHKIIHRIDVRILDIHTESAYIKRLPREGVG